MTPTVIGGLARGARIAAIAILIGWSITQIGFRVTDWSLSDMDAYWNAGLRLRNDEPLFPPLADLSAPDVYRYAPWFAALWAPLTVLPKGVVAIGWSFLVIGGVLVSIRPLLRPDLTSIAACLFFGSFLVWAASVGNVQPLIVAGLIYSLDRRAGPMVIGIAASLKAVPIMFVLIYLGRREWMRAAVAIAVAVILGGTFLFVDMANYPAAPGDAPSPLFALSPVAFAAGAAIVALVAVTLAARASPHDRFGGACAALASLPRITLLDLPMLLVGIRPDGRRARSER